MTHTLHESSNAARFRQLWVNAKGTHNDTWATDKSQYKANLGAFMGKAREDSRSYRE